MLRRNHFLRIFTLAVVLVLGVSMGAQAEECDAENVLDVRAALQAALDDAPGWQEADRARAAWERKLEDAKEKQKKGRNIMLVGIGGGVALSLIGPFTGTSATMPTTG